MKIGSDEVMLLGGLVLFGAGLWVLYGYGCALAGCGAGLIGTAWFNAWLKSREAKRGVI